MKPKKAKQDECLVHDVDVCIVCYGSVETPKGNGVRAVICQRCYKRIQKRYKDWNKKGLWLINNEE